MKLMVEAAEFLRRVRIQMRFGEMSREPLRLLRLELDGKGDTARCDWVLRPPDPWDREIPERVRETNQTLQALSDALGMRKLLFQTFPKIRSAQIKVFREVENAEPELIMVGAINREDAEPFRIPSIVMRAQLCGFKFLLADGVLKTLS